MIKLSKLSDYAIVVLSRLSGAEGGVVTVAQMTTYTGIPEPTVSKVLKLLAREGIIESTRGANGGYALKRPASGITVTELITALEGPIALTTCIDKQSDEGGCMIDSLCPLRGGWKKVNDALTKALDEVSLDDLLIPAPTPRRAS